MTKIKKLIIVLLAATVLCFLCAGAVIPAFAETEPPATEETESTAGDSLEGLAAQFTEYLKGKYGGDYEYYYNQIIDNWGSVEGYLLSFGGKLPEEYRSGWDKFVSWLGEYAPVWATPLAIIIVITVAVVGKKFFRKLVEKTVNAKLSPIVDELNLQSNGIVSLSRGQRALLGNNEKFAENVKELEESERGLKGE